MSEEQAAQVLEHLTRTGQGFCFIASGGIVGREDCERVLLSAENMSQND